MAKVRKIDRNPAGRNYYIVDACFLANKYIPLSCVPNQKEKQQIEKCLNWWKEIDAQIKNNKARVYIPDLCIAETFKVLAKKHYKDRWFKQQNFDKARKQLRDTIVISRRHLHSYKRRIKYHDISTSRDIIISVDRFLELFLKKKLNVSVVDLIILATAKYVMDFYDIPKKLLHIVTIDKTLWEGGKKMSDLPRPYNPIQASDASEKVFKGGTGNLFRNS